MSVFKKKNKKQNAEPIRIDERLQHIAFIMDGNGRWAKKRGLPREFGHRAGAKVFKDISIYCGDIGIKTVTVYAFSTENWKRPEKEVSAIMLLLKEYLFEALDTMAERDAQIHFLGDRSPFDDEFKALMERTERESAGNGRVLNIALNYGGRDEIIHAVNRAVSSGKSVITEEDVSAGLYTAHCPDPDLIVRTGGEFRLSNFLMWPSAYSEPYFTDKYWPDKRSSDVDEAVREFYSRSRRFGGI